MLPTRATRAVTTEELRQWQGNGTGTGTAPLQSLANLGIQLFSDLGTRVGLADLIIRGKLYKHQMYAR